MILSKNRENLDRCVRAIFEHEPALAPERIIVVDDGIRSPGDTAPIEVDGRKVTTLAGEKPFVFARNANLGIRHAKTDVILLNDDAFLATPGGFSSMAEIEDGNPRIGLLSAAVRGLVCNPLQQDNGKREIRQIGNNMAFVCVYVPRRLYEVIGYLDERFTGYGMEDNDYCLRSDATGAFLKAATNTCVVEHSGRSTYRSNREEWKSLYAHSRGIFEAKWGRDPNYERVVDLMYVAFNRLEFTKESFASLRENTDWRLVNELWIYDDGSTDGTREYLASEAQKVPVDRKIICSQGGGPVGAMRHFFSHATSPFLAKIDCDTVLPERWLNVSLEVMAEDPDLALLGIEPHEVPIDANPRAERSWRPAKAIGGIGLYHSWSFIDSQPDCEGLYFGFWNWQLRNPRLKRGFLDPGMPVFLLDRIPDEPWRGLSDGYIEKGWQRPWQNYVPQQKDLWAWRFQSA